MPYRLPRLTLCAGLVATAGACARPPAPDLMPRMVRANDWVIMAAAANQVLLTADDSATVCVSLFHGPADFDIPQPHLVMLDHPGIVPMSACPPTHARMFVETDSLGNPRAKTAAARPDPHHLRILHPERDGADHAWVDVRLEKGTGGFEFLCSVRTLRREPEAHCRRGRSWVH